MNPSQVEYPIRKKKNVVVILAIVLAVVLLGVGIFFGIRALVLRSKPMLMVAKAIDNSMKAAEKSEVFTTAENVFDNGQVEISVNLSSFIADTIGLPLDLKAIGQINFDKDAGRTAVQGKASFLGIDVADLNMSYDKNSFAVRSDVLFGSDAYGVNLKNLNQNFPQSQFAEGKAYDLGITEEDIRVFADTLAGVSNGKTSERQKKFFEKFTEKLADIIQENAEISEEKGTLAFEGGDVKVESITVRVDGKAAANICKETLSALIDNKISGTEEFLESILTYLSAADADLETTDELRQALKDALLEIEEEEENGGFDELKMTVVFHISSSGSQLIGFDADIENGGSGVKLRSVFGPDWKDIRDISVDAQVNGVYTRYSLYDGIETDVPYESRLTLSYIVSENSDNAFHAKIRVCADDETTLDGGIDWDRKNGDWSIRFNADESELALSGTLFKTKKDMTMTLDSVAIDGESLGIKDLSIGILFDAPKPEVIEDYRDVLTLSEDELDKLFGSVESFSEDFSERLAEKLLSGIGAFSSYSAFGD